MPPTVQGTPSTAVTRSILRPARQRRPATIAELAERARDTAWDPNLSLKHWLKAAERHRNSGFDHIDSGDLENGFVELARAATIVMEKVPTHKDYQSQLNPTLRKNLGSNGQDILDRLADVKKRLIDCYDFWASQYPEEAAQYAASLTSSPSQSYSSDAQQQDDRRRRDAWRREEEEMREAEEQRRQREQQKAQARRVEESAHAYAEVRKPASQPDHERRTVGDTSIKKLTDAMAAARIAAKGTSSSPTRLTHESPNDARPEETRRRLEEARRREEEMEKRRAEEGRRQEREGIARRQQELDLNARALRHRNAGLQQLPAPTAISRSSNTLDPSPGQLLMPLESPSRDEVSDNESFKPSRYLSNEQSHPHRNPYPVPVTTTSPVPVDQSISYPQLMTTHQMTQGYAPSLASMFNGSMRAPIVSQSLLFAPDPSRTPLTASLYPQGALPKPSAPIPQTNTSFYTQRPNYRHSYDHTASNTPVLHTPRPSSSKAEPSNSASNTRITRSVSKTDPVSRDPRPVTLPRQCLPRFLSIAAANTARNRETCGLLLGKDKGRSFLVTTLLIPKQHSTSDTCTMDEEELVLKFTEERNLITLGWIHTHPSQSCFMSSVDLHTHSGFQRMLPESFAVVCAPKSNPNFGIFRLTDPPGLQTILECTAKEAFHPHPERPIYTDADKGHVTMKDSALEIVDLR